MPDAAQTLTLSQALTLYKAEHLTGRNLALLTRLAYSSDLTEVVEHLAPLGVHEARSVTRAQLEHYLASLDARGLSGNYRRRKIAAIRSLFAFLEERELIPASPASRLIPPERERLQPRFLTETEYRRLLEAVRGEPRDGAIIELLLQTGMRLSECARLVVSDISLPTRISKEPDGAGSVHIFGKGRRERTVTLNWKACKALRLYLSVRPDTGAPQLFITKFGQGIGPRSIENVVAKYLAEADIRGASVHSLRHTFGTHSVKKGTQLKVVQDALGHADLKTTSIYIGLAREDMDRQLQDHAL